MFTKNTKALSMMVIGSIMLGSLTGCNCKSDMNKELDDSSLSSKLIGDWQSNGDEKLAVQDFMLNLDLIEDLLDNLSFDLSDLDGIDNPAIDLNDLDLIGLDISFLDNDIVLSLSDDNGEIIGQVVMDSENTSYSVKLDGNGIITVTSEDFEVEGLHGFSLVIAGIGTNEILTNQELIDEALANPGESLGAIITHISEISVILNIDEISVEETVILEETNSSTLVITELNNDMLTLAANSFNSYGEYDLNLDDTMINLSR